MSQWRRTVDCSQERGMEVVCISLTCSAQHMWLNFKEPVTAVKMMEQGSCGLFNLFHSSSEMSMSQTDVKFRSESLWNTCIQLCFWKNKCLKYCSVYSEQIIKVAEFEQLCFFCLINFRQANLFSSLLHWARRMWLDHLKPSRSRMGEGSRG